MKKNSLKTVVVKLNNSTKMEFEIDSTIYDDIYVEAATRAIETIKHDPSAIIRPIIETWEKNKPISSVVCNSYWILVNSALYGKAEKLREKFLIQHDKDLAKEPLRGSTSTKSK